MGLFRRGTKLLKFGSGLRDCCCRPEKPEECWCPDTCGYYWYWDGGLRVPARTLLSQEPCDGFGATGDGYIIGEDEQGAYGAGDSIFPNIFGLPKRKPAVVAGKYSGQFQISYSEDMLFRVDDATADALYPEKCAGFPGVPSVGVQYYTFFEVIIGCFYVGGAPKLRIVRANLEQFVRAFSGYTCSKYLYYSSKLNNLSFSNQSANVISGVASSCLRSANLTCDGDEANRFRLGEDLIFSIGKEGVSVNGTNFGWNVEYPIEQDDTVAWQIEGEYPLSVGASEFTLKRLNSCQPGLPCDCTASLSGRQVLFEGKTFNYGSLDNFYEPAPPGSSYSGTWWEEDPVGTFTRYDRENCDPTLNQNIKKVEVDCINEGGVDKWVAYIDHTCNERDDAVCPGPADAQRVKQWTGFFLCDENGSPTGSPTDLEVDYDVTSGTPAAECVDALQPPSFEFL